MAKHISISKEEVISGTLAALLEESRATEDETPLHYFSISEIVDSLRDKYAMKFGKAPLGIDSIYVEEALRTADRLQIITYITGSKKAGRKAIKYYYRIKTRAGKPKKELSTKEGDSECRDMLDKFESLGVRPAEAYLLKALKTATKRSENKYASIDAIHDILMHRGYNLFMDEFRETFARELCKRTGTDDWHSNYIQVFSKANIECVLDNSAHVKKATIGYERRKVYGPKLI